MPWPSSELSTARSIIRLAQVMVAYFSEVGPIGGWLDYLNNGLKCSLPHDKIYASLGMLHWDEHFPRPQVNYGKSSVKLVEEVLPHLSGIGIGFPANVRMLLELVSTDVQQDDVELQALRDKRNPISAGQLQATSKGQTPVRCSCENPMPSTTAIWRCSMWHDERISSTKLSQGSNNSLVVPTKLTKSSKKRNFARERPEHSLTIVGKHVEKSIHEVVGFVDRHARPGDVLVRSPGHTSRAHLVLRRAYGDLYEIIGYAAIDSVMDLDGEESADEEARSPEQRAQSQLEQRPQSEPPDSTSTAADPLCFDFRLDAEDVLAYAFPLGSKDSTYGIKDVAKLIKRSFKRSHFSSFATACSGERPFDIYSTCPECAIGSRQRICIECGWKFGP